MNKQRALSLTDEEWKLARKASDKSDPKVTRPVWIGVAIREKAKREGVK
jgi:hypothetical protein